jgi:hypothetical protein
LIVRLDSNLTATQLRTDLTQSLYGIFGNSETDIYIVGARSPATRSSSTAPRSLAARASQHNQRRTPVLGRNQVQRCVIRGFEQRAVSTSLGGPQASSLALSEQRHPIGLSGHVEIVNRPQHRQASRRQAPQQQQQANLMFGV